MASQQNETNLHRTIINSGTFFWKTSKETVKKPKHQCIEEAGSNDCELVCEQQYAQYDGAPVFRRFGYFKDVSAYLDDNKFRNDHFYEVAKGECKLYIDIGLMVDGMPLLSPQFPCVCSDMQLYSL